MNGDQDQSSITAKLNNEEPVVITNQEVLLVAQDPALIAQNQLLSREDPLDSLTVHEDPLMKSSCVNVSRTTKTQNSFSQILSMYRIKITYKYVVIIYI